MTPEEIDKLFKERLGNNSPTPPADMWARLQERMGAEEETPVALPQETAQKAGKQRYMWVYSSVAATLSLLLTVGVVFYNVKTGTPGISEVLTKHEVSQPQETPTVEPVVTPAPEVNSSESAMAVNKAITEELAGEEKKSNPQATVDNYPASNITKAPVQQKAVAKLTSKAVQQHTLAKTTVSKVIEADVQPAIAVNNSKSLNSESNMPATDTEAASKSAVAVAKSDANMNAEPVEIIIKRSVASQTVMAENNLQDGGRKKVALAKNIFKQVRNLASGEEVELSELGIRADRVALETQIGKQKISKVINL